MHEGAWEKLALFSPGLSQSTAIGDPGVHLGSLSLVCRETSGLDTEALEDCGI